MPHFTEDYLRGLGLSTRNNALAYGYSVTATASFAVLTRTDQPAGIGRIFLFVAGAGLAFAGVNAIVTRGFRARVETEPPVVLALATSLSAVSISAGVGAATLLGILLGGWLAWLLAAVLSTWVYLFTAALEIATARALHINLGEKHPDER
jgi:drug/metabolite transporter (DMT)-like permease